MQYLGATTKMTEWSWFVSKANQDRLQVYAPITNAKEVNWFYEHLHDLVELTPKKRCPFHHRGLECKSRKSRDTWNNRQILAWSTKWSTAKANRILSRKQAGQQRVSKLPLWTTQETTLHMAITNWPLIKSNWLYTCSQRWRSSI